MRCSSTVKSWTAKQHRVLNILGVPSTTVVRLLLHLKGFEAKYREAAYYIVYIGKRRGGDWINALASQGTLGS